MLTNTFIVAERDPVAVGWKMTEIVQETFGARLAGQLLVWPKSPALVPLIVIPLNARMAPLVLVLVRVFAIAALLVPSAMVPKESLVGLTVAIGEPPEPVRLTVPGLLEAFE